MGGYVVPLGLSKILKVSRQKNTRNRITSILGYTNGYYLHLLEGPVESVDTLLETISRDSRHNNVDLLIEAYLEKRFLPETPIKLINEVDKNLYFKHFFQRHQNDLYRLDNKKKALLYQLTQFSATPQNRHTPTRRESDITQSRMTLLRWPDFDEIELTPETIELCSLLINGPYSYSQLQAMSMYNNQRKELDRTLKILFALGILDTKKDMRIQAQSLHSASLKSSLSENFYHKVKIYLRRLM